jgi:hypothetical protein
MWCAHSRSGHFSPSWLAPLRFTSVEKRPDRLSIFARGLTGGHRQIRRDANLDALAPRRAGDRTSLVNHDEKNHRRSPPPFVERR